MKTTKTPPTCPICNDPLTWHNCTGTKDGCSLEKTRAKKRQDPAYQELSEQLTQQRIRYLEERDLIHHVEHTSSSSAEAKVRTESVQALTELLDRAQTQTQFLEGARSIWQTFRAKKEDVRQGKPSEWKRIGPVIAEWFIRNNQDLTERPKDYPLIKHVCAVLPDIHRDTARKYVKLWRLLYTLPPDRTEAEWRWLAKHEPDEVQAWADCLSQARVSTDALDLQEIPRQIEPDTVRVMLDRITRALQP